MSCKQYSQNPSPNSIHPDPPRLSAPPPPPSLSPLFKCTAKLGDMKSNSSFYCPPPLSRKRGDIKSHSSVCLSVRLSVTKTLTMAITFALLQVDLWYLACVLFVRRPFWWYHAMTLTMTFDLLQGQICCRAGNHNSLNLLVICLCACC